MLRYFISVKQLATGVHIIHKGDCPLLPDKKKRIFLGIFRSSLNAAREGRRYFKRIIPCPFCMMVTHSERKTTLAGEFLLAYGQGPNDANNISLADGLLCGLN